MEEIYRKEGAVQHEVGAIITLIVGVGVAALVLIFVAALGGSTYNLVEPQINAINNSSIRNYAKQGIVSAFQALGTTGTYLPLIVLAVVIFIILGLILGMTGMGGQYGGGSAL